MINIEGLYSTLLTATFGGLPFSVVDTTEETGRRMLQFLFPGVDNKDFQDMGADDGPIALRGLLVGDDYLAQKRAWQAVCRSPGPYTLNHPWLGSKRVVFAPGTRAKFSLAANELRVLRIEMQLLAFNPSAQPGPDTLSRLAVAADVLQADAQNWLAGVMQPAVNLLGAFGYVQSWLGNVAGVFSAAIGATASSVEIAPACANALAALIAPTAALSPGWGAATAATLLALPAAIAGAASPLVPSAVAPGGATTAAAAADPGDTVTTLLAAIPGIAAGAAMPVPGPALAAGLQAAVIGAAVQVSAGINYQSQQDAQATGALLYAAIDAAILSAAIAAVNDPKNAGAVWRDLEALKGCLAADLNALVGRLPAVVTIQIPRTMPAWIIAQYISGDVPAQVYATYVDIIARNKIKHPGLVPPGPLEVLDS